MLLVEAAWVRTMLLLRVLLHLSRMAEGLLLLLLLAGVVKQIRENVLVLHLHHVLLLLPGLAMFALGKVTVLLGRHLLLWCLSSN